MGILSTVNDVARHLGWNSPFPDEAEDLTALMLAFAINPTTTVANNDWLNFSGIGDTLAGWWNSALEAIAGLLGYEKPDFLNKLGSPEAAISTQRAGTFVASVDPDLATKAVSIIQGEIASLTSGLSAFDSDPNRAQMATKFADAVFPKLEKAYITHKLAAHGIVFPPSTSLEDIKAFLADDDTPVAGQTQTLGQLILAESTQFANETAGVAQAALQSGRHELDFSSVNINSQTTAAALAELAADVQALAGIKNELQSIKFFSAAGVGEEDWFDITRARQSGAITEQELADLGLFSTQELTEAIGAADASALEDAIDGLENIDIQSIGADYSGGARIQVIGSGRTVNITVNR